MYMMISSLSWKPVVSKLFLSKAKMINILGFTYHTVSAATTQLCCNSMKKIVDCETEFQ